MGLRGTVLLLGVAVRCHVSSILMMTGVEAASFLDFSLRVALAVWEFIGVFYGRCRPACVDGRHPGD